MKAGGLKNQVDFVIAARGDDPQKVSIGSQYFARLTLDCRFPAAVEGFVDYEQLFGRTISRSGEMAGTVQKDVNRAAVGGGQFQRSGGGLDQGFLGEIDVTDIGGWII